MPYAANGNVQLWFESFGDPASPTLLLVNGLGSQCINYRVEWCERFVAAGFRVIRFDNRDVGLSTHLSDDVEYTVADMARDAVAVLDAAGVARAHLCGLSMGGMIVQQVCIDHPERALTATSVMSTTGDPDVGHPAPEAIAHLLSPAANDRDGAIARHLKGLHTYGSPGYVDDEVQARYAGEAYDRSFDPGGVARQLAAIRRSGSRSDGLRRVQVPFLVLHGSEDRLVDPSGGQRTAEMVPGARLVLLEGMGHDYPEPFWDRWVALVAEHAGLAGAAEIAAAHG